MSVASIATTMRAALIGETWTEGFAPIDGPDLTAMCRAIATAIASGVAPVATLSALAAIDTTSELDGAAYYVNEVEDWYILEKATSHTADGLCVITGLNGGYWVARFVGRWDDLQGSITEGDAKGALTWELYRDTPLKMAFFRHNQDDQLSFAWQLPHKWRPGTAVRPHLHCVPMASSAGNLYFSWSYCWAVYGSVIPSNSSWTTGTTTKAIASGDQYKHIIVDFSSISPPVGAKESSVLLFFVSRLGTNILDTYDGSKTGGTAAANLGLLSADMHYQSTKYGTEQEYPA